MYHPEMTLRHVEMTMYHPEMTLRHMEMIPHGFLFSLLQFIHFYPSY